LILSLIFKNIENIYESDPGRIKQVLINLISNSVKFTPKGGIKLLIEEKIGSHWVELIFSVHDTGIGISQKDKKNLFKMFGMEKKQIKVINQHGTGIGLVISKKIVESLDGEINGKFSDN